MTETRISIRDGNPPPEAPAGEPGRVCSPPPAARPEVSDPDPAARLHELARQLMRTRGRRQVVEYLRLRRAIR